MQINENKYNELFTEKFKVNKDELNNEFKRVIEEYGNTEEVKSTFYLKSFETVISQIKKDLPKDENYEYVISTLYNYFIEALEEDEIESSKYKNELIYFKTTEISLLPKVMNVEAKSYQPVYKNYNPNTKYGRRKAREQAAANYQNGSPEYKKEIDNIRAVVWIIIIIIGIVIFWIKASSK